MKHFFLIVLSILLITNILTAQININDTKLYPTRIDSLNENIKIPELNVFLNSAIKNSPLLMATDREIDQILEKVKIEKKSWLDFLYIDGNGRYGLFDQLTVSQQTTGSVVPTGIKLANQQFNYYVGLSIKLPLSNFSSRKNEINILKYSQQASESKKQELIKELTLSVIDEYYKLINLQESMAILQEIFETYEISYLKATKEIETGTMDLSQFAVLVSNHGTAKANYVKTKNDFFSQYYKLQALTGINLNKK